MTITDFFTTVAQIKEYVREVDASGSLDSFKPVYRPAAKKYINLVGQATYDKLKTHLATPPDPSVPSLDSGLEYTRAALANLLAINWFILDSGSRNATDKKLFRYQEAQIREVYIEQAWAELDQLIALMEANKTVFTDFAAAELYKQREDLYIKSAADFDRYFNIGGSSYFYFNAIFIQTEVEIELVRSRLKETTNDDDTLYLVKKAIAFETVARACERFDYSELPKGIRNDIGQEIGGSVNRNELGNVKISLAEKLHQKAMQYIESLDIKLQAAAADGTAPIIPENVNSEDNKFYLTI